MKLIPPKLEADPGFYENKAHWDAQSKFRSRAIPLAAAAAETLRQELRAAGYSETEHLQ